MQAVLASEIFQRSPSVAQMLSYICEKYFAGETDALKEYSIAVDALRRPYDFDQKTDSIVRVEAHRLRKKLGQYYATEGAAHSVRITVPQGQYAPLFVHTANSEPTAIMPSHAPQLEVMRTIVAEPVRDLQIPPPPAANATRLLSAPGTSPKWQPLAAVALVILAVVAWQGYRALHRSPGRGTARTPIAAPNQQNSVRIAAGLVGAQYIDHMGRIWQPDAFFSGGTRLQLPQRNMTNTIDPALFATARVGHFHYDIPASPAVYEVHLHFAEREFGDNMPRGGGEGNRPFSVKVNGALVLPQIDVFSDAAGADIAHERVIRDVKPLPDGKIHLEFIDQQAGALVSGIEVLRGQPGKLLPVRIVAGNGSVMDSTQQVWGLDRNFTGGVTVQRPEPVESSKDPQLFQGERYGHFTYTIPVATNGRYELRMMFSERWFGPDRPGHGGAGSRRFDVYCNGTALLRNFDIFTAAGGSNKALVRRFENLEPSAAGQLVLSFVPRENYASINALEVMEQ